MKLGSSIQKLDKLLLISSLLLFMFGLVMIFSSSTVASVLAYKQPSYYFVLRQGGVELAMLFVSLIIINIDTKFYSNFKKILPIIMIAMLVAVKFFGTNTNGATSWISILGFNFQASEFVKSFLIIWLACVYGDKKKWTSQTSLAMPLIIPIICVALIASEPDLGTAIIVAAIIALIFIELPIKKNKIMKYGALAGVIGIGIVLLLFQTGKINKILTPAQQSRINFLNPCSRYLEKTGYQVCNSYIAINNGGLKGLGLGNSKQKNLYLPEAYTDFIYPIIVEEFGLIGIIILFIAYIILLFSILTIARNANNLRNSIIAFGTFCYILVHLIVNLLGVTGLFLMTGVPLPFMSYGGSYVINLFILLSLTQRVAIETKIAKKKA